MTHSTSTALRPQPASTLNARASRSAFARAESTWCREDQKRSRHGLLTATSNSRPRDDSRAALAAGGRDGLTRILAHVTGVASPPRPAAGDKDIRPEARERDHADGDLGGPGQRGPGHET